MSQPADHEPDKAAADTVRSYLPNMLIGRASALLALVIPFFEQIAQFNVSWAKIFPDLPSGWKNGILLGCALVVIVQAINEWRVAKNKRQTDALALKPYAVPRGYFRIGPYQDNAEDRAQFDRADQAHEQVLAWLQSAEAVPLYLSGDSGSGKSSLLNAYVLPRLRQQEWTVIEARGWQDPEAALRAGLARFLGNRRKPDEALRNLLEAAARRAEGRLLAVLDQFEEFVILAPPEAQRAFAALLAELHKQPVKGLHLLLVLRQEYETHLEKLGLPALHQRKNWWPLEHFTVNAARGFMEKSGLGLQAASLERILDSAAKMDGTPGLIRPITLNVIGHVLAEGNPAAPTLDADKLVQDYLGKALNRPPIRDYARPVLEQLVTGQNTKPCSKQALAKKTGLSRGEVGAVLNRLGEKYLARPLDENTEVWELAHDFVACAISFYLGRQRHDVWRQMALQAAPIVFGTMLLSVSSGAALLEYTRRQPILPDMVEIKPGEFCMGSRDKDDPPENCPEAPVDPQAQDYEKPLRRVKIAKAFLLAKYEVTLEEYERYVYDQGINSPGDGGFSEDIDPKQRKCLPVVNVSWGDAKKYAAWLSAKTGRRFRLPTEAEWEYAARAGTATPYPWDKLPGTACDYANGFDRKHTAELKRQYPTITWSSLPCDDAYAHAAPAGSFRPNAWSLHDMAGNVWEWVEDCWHEDYKGAPADGSAATTEAVGDLRVVRGGSWGHKVMYLRPALRDGYTATGRYSTLGFRLAQDL